jgi:hypothetical protein
MEKISLAQVLEVMSAQTDALRKVAAERDMARAENEAYRNRMEAEKVASMMIQKGLSNEPREKLIEQMEKAAREGKLERIYDAVDLQGPDMGEKVAQMVSDETVTVSASASDLERFIMGDVG